MTQAQLVKHLMLNSSATIWTSSLYEANVRASNSLRVSVRTVLNNDLSGLGAFVGLWEGLGALGSINNLLGVTPLKGISDGNPVEIDIITDAPGVDLFNGFYTLGLFLNKNVPNSLAASVSLIQGAALGYQQTSIMFSSHIPRSIDCYYTVPNFVQPSTRGDWIFLLKGDKPVTNNSNPIPYTPVPSNQSDGTIVMDVENISLNPGDYIAQYEIGYTHTVAAACAFSLAS